jgi:hypothetical protein
VNISQENEEEVSEEMESIIKSVEASQLEIRNLAYDFVLYGAGCCKITPYPDHNEFRLTQIPQEALKIFREDKEHETPIYMVENKNTGTGTEDIYKMLGAEYPEDFTYKGKELETVWWLGRDNFYNFYSKPRWLPCMDSLDAQIALKTFDTEKINTGFNMNNVLFFNKNSTYINPKKPQQKNNKDNKTNKESDENESATNYFEQFTQQTRNRDDAERIKNELQLAGTGTAVLYEVTTDPMNMQNVSLSDPNWEYLIDKHKQADQEIISAFSIPRERYMLNDVKESMNSNKTASFWEIYVKSLHRRQRIYEEGLKEIIYSLYDLSKDIVIDIEIPTFSDIVNAKIERFSDLFTMGAITLGQLTMLLSKYITDINWDEIDWNDPIYDERFIGGQAVNVLNDTLGESSERYSNYLSSNDLQ